jgi:predicted alpha/beta hydrolase family esterase
MEQLKKRKTQVLFAHSAGPQYGPGKGSYDLGRFLKSHLPKTFQFLFPTIEKPRAPTYVKYRDMYKKVFAKIKQPIILVGHSLGGSTLLKYLSEEKPDISVAGLFLVSTPHWKSNMKEFELKDNFEASLKNINQVFLYHSKKDSEVPIDHLAFYEHAFKKATVRKIDGEEHLFSKGLPELISDIKSLAL